MNNHSNSIFKSNETNKDASWLSEGVNIEFQNLRFSVKGKEILKGISGQCVAGRLFAILGQSGSGKTTFLDVLACNPCPGGKVQGKVLVNGTLRRPSTFRQLSSYVLQREVLMPSASVRECILTSALLKLPLSMPRKDKEARVDIILEVLGLQTCQHTLIGDELLGIKGISGGQRKRVSIGIELIKDPKVLFLDECTSGLDSETAVSMLDTLKALARRNRTIVLTIHQPNSLITSKFDDLLLLADGRMAYCGPWDQSVEFFDAAGLHCPQFINPTDYFINVLQNKTNIDMLVEQQRRRAGGGDKEEGALELELSTSLAAAAAPQVEPDLPEKTASAFQVSNKSSPTASQISTKKEAHAGKPAVSWYYQTYVLTLRYLRNYVRNPVMLASELSQYILFGVFIGLMYLQLNNSVETGILDRSASVWFGLAVLSLTPSYTAIVVWDKERVLLRREAGQALYSISAWFAARTFVTTVTQIVETLLFGLIAFFMVGYAITFSNVAVYLIAHCLFQLISESIGVLCAAVTKTTNYAILLATLVMLMLLSFSGFLVSDIPVYFKWARDVSYLTYAYSAIIVSIFENTEFVCQQGPPLCPTQGLIVPGMEVLPENMYNDLGVWTNIGVLFGLAVGCRVLCFISIYIAFRIHFL